MPAGRDVPRARPAAPPTGQIGWAVAGCGRVGFGVIRYTRAT